MILKQLAADIGNGPAIAVGTQRLLEQNQLSTATRETDVFFECQVQLDVEGGNILTRSRATPCGHLTDHHGPMKRASAKVQGVHDVCEVRPQRLGCIAPRASTVIGQIHDGHIQPQDLGG